MNYCPLSGDNTPQQLSWGHDKEVVAVKGYIKKFNSKHKGMEVFHSGLFIDNQHPYLGVKSIFSKRNLPPHVAAASYPEEVDG